MIQVLPHVARLCAIEQPYLSEQESRPLFAEAMCELSRYHQARTPGYARWLDDMGADLDCIAECGDWRALPPVMTRLFKYMLPSSGDEMDATEMRSSGTSGQTSRMRYDTHSLAALMRMCDRIWAHYGWITPDQPCNYLMLSYEPDASVAALGNARTNEFLCHYAPVNRAVYALRATGDAGQAHEFDAHGVIRALEEFAEEGLPVRMLGFPSFLWFVLERMRKRGHRPLALHPDSLVNLGGGWKLHAGQEVDKAVLRARLAEQLGIDPQRCRDGYGAVEHGVPYIECAHHRFHVPSYASACIRDPLRYRVCEEGATGLLHLMAPYIMACPAHSVIPGDLATLWPPGDCACGLPTASFILHGRAGNAGNRSCAIAAAELI